MRPQTIERQEKILSSLQKLTFLSKSQIQRIHNTGTYRNTTKILCDMKDFLSSFQDGEKIYYLNKKGRARVGSDKVVKRSNQTRHYIMRNELYIALNRPTTWRNEMKIEDVNLICDAVYKNGDRHTFIEVDHTQDMTRNRAKIRKYKKLNGRFDLIWLTTTEHRRRRLAEMCKGLNVRIYTMEDLR